MATLVMQLMESRSHGHAAHVRSTWPQSQWVHNDAPEDADRPLPLNTMMFLHPAASLMNWDTLVTALLRGKHDQDNP